MSPQLGGLNIDLLPSILQLQADPGESLLKYHSRVQDFYNRDILQQDLTVQKHRILHQYVSQLYLFEEYKLYIHFYIDIKIHFKSTACKS